MKREQQSQEASDRYAELRHGLTAATPGYWFAKPDGTIRNELGNLVLGDTRGIRLGRQNAALIALAHNQLPRLLAERDELLAALKAVMPLADTACSNDGSDEVLRVLGAAQAAIERAEGRDG